MTDDQDARIVFPCDDYPIKVVMRAAPGIRAAVDAVFARHFGPLAPDRNSARGSAQGNFLAVTYAMRVDHVEQLSALHLELRALDGVIMVL